MKAKYKLLALMVVLTLLAPNMVLAQDELCDGLRGSELGICKAYLAAGCYSGDHPSESAACDSLTDAYYNVSGGESPPWDEVLCPCPNFLTSLSSIEWQQTPETICSGRDTSDVDWVDIIDISDTVPYAGVFYSWELGYGFCQIDNISPYIQIYAQTTNPGELEVCAQQLWNFAQNQTNWMVDGVFPDFQPSPSP